MLENHWVFRFKLPTIHDLKDDSVVRPIGTTSNKPDEMCYFINVSLIIKDIEPYEVLVGSMWLPIKGGEK